jgi:hypothetical protein
VGIRVPNITVGSFVRAVQISIMEALYVGGGGGMVAKDSKGRFVRDDGSLIFPWRGDKPAI